MNDKELRIQLQLKFKLSSVDFPEFSRIDGYLFQNNPYDYNADGIKYWVERKVRNNTFDAYPDAVVDAAKWDALIHIESITTIPALLAYGWSCGTWGTVQPSRVTKFKTELLTPSMESVSLNKGVERSVIKIDLSEFQIHSAKLVRKNGN
jgi:hypothetical protein